MKYSKNLRKIILYMLVLTFFSQVLVVFAVSEQLYVNQETVDRGFPVRHAADGDWAGGELFMPGVDFITRAELKIRTLGDPDFDLTLEIRENSYNGVLSDSLTIPKSSLSSSFSWVEFNFTDIAVTSDSKYYIGASLPPSGLENSFGYELGYSKTDTYSDGVLTYTNNTGASWYKYDNYDLALRIYGYNEEPVTPDLEISTDSSVMEKQVFLLRVVSNGNPIQNAMVSFNNDYYYTSSDGYVTLTAPEVDANTNYEINVEKTGYNSDSTSISVTNIPDPEDPQLEQIVVSSIEEEKDFKVTITAEGSPVVGATVSFIGISYMTDTNGEATFKAPSVDADTEYTVSTSKTGYNSVQSIIKVTNKQETNTDSYLSGAVTDSDDAPLSHAKICIYHKDDSTNSNCVYTDENGLYSIILEPGTYNVIVSKNNYLKSNTNNVVITEGLVKNLYFKLQEKQETEKDTNTLLDYTVEEETKKGSVVGIVDISEENEDIELFGDLDIDVKSKDIKSDEGIDITFSGEETPGTKIVIYIGEVDPEEILVKYDGEIISESSNVELFFSKNNENNDYIIATAQGKSMIVINIPHYSEHHISITTIAEVLETVDVFTILWIYATVFCVASLLFIGVVKIRKRL